MVGLVAIGLKEIACSSTAPSFEIFEILPWNRVLKSLHSKLGLSDLHFWIEANFKIINYS